MFLILRFKLKPASSFVNNDNLYQANAQNTVVIIKM